MHRASNRTDEPERSCKVIARSRFMRTVGMIIGSTMGLNGRCKWIWLRRKERTHMEYTLEQMSSLHRHEVIDIFNYFIQHSFAAYPEEPVEYAFYDYFLELARGLASSVAKHESGNVVGFALLRPYHPAKTFTRTAEITYFIMPHHTRMGIGSLMLGELVQKARNLGIDNLVASIASLNDPSIRFHEKHGFQQCGRLSNVGRKFGKDFDVVWMQLIL